MLKKAVIFVMSSVLVLSSGIGFPLKSQASNTNLKVDFIDVGQGDSEFIMLPNGKNILIDAGDTGKTDEVEACLKKNSVRTIDYLIATHPHADHIGSMADIVNDYNIGTFYTSKPVKEPTTKCYKNLLKALEEKSETVNYVCTSNKIYVLLNEKINSKTLKVEFIAPCKKDYSSDYNEYSVVTKVSYGDEDFLFTGDAQVGSETDMLKKYKNELDCEVLKVGHHGSSTSSSAQFLSAVTPEYSVISVGKNNSYGHPSADTLSRLNKVNSKILRTDLVDTVEMSSDGTAVFVNSDELTLSNSSIKIPVGGQKKLTATMNGAKWKSSDVKIATVSANGTVKAIKVGKAVITCICDKSTAKCTLYSCLPKTTANAESVGIDSIKVSWSKVASASGYYVYGAQSSSGTYKKIATVNNSTYSVTFKKLVCSKVYYYKVYAYSSLSSGCNSAASAVVSAKPVPNKVYGVKLSKSGSSAVNVKWNASSGASGYEIYRASGSSGSFSKIKDTSSISYKNSSLKKGKTYYYKVRAYKTVNNKKVYGSFSDKKGIKL